MKKLFKKLNEMVEVVRIENKPITEEEIKKAEKEVVFESKSAKAVDLVNIKDE